MNTFEQMIDRGHERVCFHHDQETGLRAIIAVHSTKLGNGLGGVRRWHYATEADALYDVLRLSEGMTYKSACCGLPMGGAKSVILKPTPDAKPTEAEAVAMGRFIDTLGGAYIAAEDVGTSPQFMDWIAGETNFVMGGEQVSRGGDPSPFTSRGVLNAMRAGLAHIGKPVDFSGVTVAIQGVGQVGYYLAHMLHERGATLIVADIDERCIERVRDLGEIEVVNTDEILFSKCDILSPCALGGVISGGMVSRLNCKIICGGANNILEDPDEDAVLLKSAGIVYTPDFVANSGGVIELSGLYLGMTRQELDNLNDRIEQTTEWVLRKGESASSTHAAAVALANQRITAGASGEFAHAD